MADCPELAGAVYEQLKHYARQPDVKTFDQAVDGLMKDFPQFDRGQIVEHIVNSSTNKAKEIPEFQRKLQMMKGEAKKEKKLLTAIEEIESALNDQLTISKTSNPTKEPSETIQRLRETRKNLMEAYNESTPAIVEKLQTQINALNERLAANDFALPVSKDTLPSSKEVLKLEQQKKDLQNVARKKIQRLRDEDQRKKAMLKDAYNFTKAMRSSFDAGFLGRQGLLVAVTNPKLAFDSMWDAAIAAWHPDRAARMQQDLMENEQAVQFMAYGGRLATDTDLNEESFGGRIDGVLMEELKKRFPTVANAPGMGWVAGKVWGGVEMSERAHRTFLNKMRVDYYTQLAQTLPSMGDPTEAEGKAIANLVNTATGYGDWQSAGTAMTTAQNVFWSARYQLSRLQMLTGHPLWSAPKSGRKSDLAFGLKIDSNKALVAQEYAKMAIGMTALAGLVGIAATGYNHDPEEEFETENTASRFMTVRFGDSYIDLSSGLRTWAVMLSRLAEGDMETRSGKVQDIIGEDTKQVSASDLGASFVRGKFAPMSAAATDVVFGRPFDDNERPGVLELGKDLFVPLPATTFIEELTDHGFSTAAAKTLADIVGFPSVD